MRQPSKLNVESSNLFARYEKLRYLQVVTLLRAEAWHLAILFSLRPVDLWIGFDGGEGWASPYGEEIVPVTGV